MRYLPTKESYYRETDGRFLTILESCLFTFKRLNHLSNCRKVVHRWIRWSEFSVPIRKIASLVISLLDVTGDLKWDLEVSHILGKGKINFQSGFTRGYYIVRSYILQCIKCRNFLIFPIWHDQGRKQLEQLKEKTSDVQNLLHYNIIPSRIIRIIIYYII